MNPSPDPLAPEKVALTPAEFAALFGRHYSWGYRLIYAGRVKVIRNLGRLTIPRSEVQRLLRDVETYDGQRRPTRNRKRRLIGSSSTANPPQGA